jgi:hypothetical protein
MLFEVIFWFYYCYFVNFWKKNKGFVLNLNFVLCSGRFCLSKLITNIDIVVSHVLNVLIGA